MHSVTVPDTAVDVAYVSETIPTDDVVEAYLLISKDWYKAQSNDPVIRQVLNHLTAGSRPSASHSDNRTLLKYLPQWDGLHVRDRVFYCLGSVECHDTWQLVLPTCLREEVFCALHDDLGHQPRCLNKGFSGLEWMRGSRIW